MANKEHVALLKQGATAWNKWRDENPKIQPDFRGANFSGADVDAWKLRDANLSGADFVRTRSRMRHDPARRAARYHGSGDGWQTAKDMLA
jgi:hypothetical protein